MSPKEVRLKLAISSACDIDGSAKYKELIDILIDEFGVRHVESLEDKMFCLISKFKDYESALKSIRDGSKTNGTTGN